MEAYRVWNIGQGMLIASPESEEVIKTAKHHGIGAKIIGKVTKESGISFRYLEKGNETKDFAGAAIQGIEELNKDIGRLDF